MHGNQHVSIYNAGVAVSARVWVRVSECASMGVRVPSLPPSPPPLTFAVAMLPPAEIDFKSAPAQKTLGCDELIIPTLVQRARRGVKVIIKIYKSMSGYYF